MNLLFSLLAGIGFGIGLTVSNMLDPQVVLAFLDIAGDWDPSLMFVMGGALIVFMPSYHLLKKRMKRPLLADSFFEPTLKDIDKPLLVGAAVFGIGWGISGICPGPAIANLSGMNEKIFAFIFMMLVGMMAANGFKRTQ
jgi:uncharacterized membrane protein YedE/YeeE